MSFSVSYSFVAIDKFSVVGKKIRKVVDNVKSSMNKAAVSTRKVDNASKRVKRSLDKVSQAMKKVSMAGTKVKDAMGRVNSSMKNAGSKIQGVGQSLSLKLTAPLTFLGLGALKAAASMETLETSFVGILGSGEKAKKIVADLTDFTAKTPFQLSQVGAAAKQLVAANVAPKKVKETLQTLGDIAAAANIPLTDMSQIFAKIKNKGKAMTEEILQLSDRGIPIIDVLAKGLGVAKDKIFDLASKGKISAKIMAQAFAKMTKKGGFANKAMILQSKTLNGVFSTLKDNIILTAAGIGQTMLPKVKELAIKVIEVTGKIRTWVKKNPKLVKMGVIFAGILAVLGPLLIGLGIAVKVGGLIAAGFGVIIKFGSLLAFGFTVVAKVVGIVSAVFAILSKIAVIVGTVIVGLSLPMWAVIAAVAALGVGIFFLIKHWGAVSKFMKNVVGTAFDFVGEKINWLVDKWKGLIDVIKQNPIAKFASGAFGKAKDAIGSLFGSDSKNEIGQSNQVVNNIQNPLAQQANKSTFDGNLSINIADRNKNVQSATLQKKGDLNVGLSGVGI